MLAPDPSISTFPSRDASSGSTVAAETIRVIVADDHKLLRQSLSSLFRESDRVDVVAQAGTGLQVLDAVDRCRPHVLVLDVSMSAMSGLEIVQTVKRSWPDVGVLVLATASEGQLAVRCLRSGADGYLTHDHSSEELLQAVERIAGGSKYLTQELADRLAESLQEGDHRPPHDLLSDREFQVMCLIAEGIPPSAIARQLDLSVKTVSTYRSRLLRKLDLGSSAEIMRYAISHDLVP